MAASVFWEYTTKIALRTDGELVAFEANVAEDRRVPSPNHSPHGVQAASDQVLVYPDVVRWDERREVEETLGRTLVDTYHSPAQYGDVLGRGLRNALQELRQAPRSPAPLGEPSKRVPGAAKVGAAPPPQQQPDGRRARSPWLALLVPIAGGVALAVAEHTSVSRTDVYFVLCTIYVPFLIVLAARFKKAALFRALLGLALVFWLFDLHRLTDRLCDHRAPAWSLASSRQSRQARR